jgi:hypothetical protein
MVVEPKSKGPLEPTPTAVSTYLSGLMRFGISIVNRGRRNVRRDGQRLARMNGCSIRRGNDPETGLRCEEPGQSPQ